MKIKDNPLKLQEIINDMNAGYSDAMMHSFAYGLPYDREDKDFTTIEKWLLDSYGFTDHDDFEAIRKQLREDIENN